MTLRIRVPASAANLGPGFDSHGLALGLYLTLEVEPCSEPYGTFQFEGEGARELQSAGDENLIFRAMRFAGTREEVELRPARIRVKNEIPLARGLGSSAAAIIAGLSAFEVITGNRLPTARLLSYASEIEGHGDNVAAALLGSFAVTCITDDGDVYAETFSWPEQIRAVVVIPDFKVRTEQARAVLPDSVSRADAVFNIQRASLMVAAVATGRFHLIAEATRDRLHQQYRSQLAPGVEEALSLARDGEMRSAGLLGVTLSGSGPAVVAFATGEFDRIGEALARPFHVRDIRAATLVLPIDNQGRVVY